MDYYGSGESGII